MVTYDQEIQHVLELTEEQTEQSDEITLSTGVVLKFKKIPILRIQAVVEQFPYPDVPEVFNKDKGRMEKNPFSEEYKKLVEEADTKRGLAVIDTVLAVGTEVSSVPDDFEKTLDSEDWIEELAIGHIKVNAASKIARYHAWVKYVAIVDQSDVGKILEQFGLQLGTGEANVASQLRNNFPDN